MATARRILLKFLPTSPRLQVLQGASGSFVLRLLSIFFGFITTLLLARALSTDGYGAYAYALAWVNLLQIPAMVGFEKLLVRETAVAVEKERWDLLRGLLRWTNIVALLTSVLIACGLASIAAMLMADNNQQKFSALLIGSALIPLMALTGLRQAVLRGLKYVVIGQAPEFIIRPILLIAVILGTTVGLRLDLTTSGALVANFLATMIAFILGSLVLGWRIPSQVRLTTPTYRRRAWTQSAAPLLALGLLQVANGQIFTLVLGMFHDSATVGIFSVTSRLSSLASLFLLSFNAALAPTFATLYVRGDLDRLQKLVTQSSWLMCLLSLPIILIFVVAGEFLLEQFGSDYVEGYASLIILGVGVFFSSAMGSVGLLLTMTGNERDAGIVIGTLLLGNILLSLVLIPTYGVVGAATATTVYLVFSNLLLGFFVFRRTGIVPSIFGRPYPSTRH